MKVIDLKNPNSDPFFALIYGNSGTGKTHLVGTLGELGYTLVIDIDKGTKTIQYAKDLQKVQDNIVAISFDQFKDLDQAYKLVEENSVDKWNAFFRAKDGTQLLTLEKPFDWIAWDTWSEIQWFMHQELRSKESDLKGSGLNFRKNLQIQHWGALTDLNKLAIEALRDCKRVNQVFTMQETMTKDELSGQVFGGPAIHGKLVQEMPAYFDIVIHTGVNLQSQYTASTKPKGKWTAKTRISEGEEVVNPRAKDFFK